MWYLAFLALWLAASVPRAQGQACTSRALLTVERAKLAQAGGDHAAAKKWIDQAKAECVTSFAVMSAISDVYQAMGDAGNAEFYRKYAERLAPKPLVYKQPDSPKPAAAAKPGESVIEDKSFVREKWALVVGVGTFRDTERIPALKYAAKDARDFADMLEDPAVGRFRRDGVHVRVLLDKDATVENLKTALNDIAKRARAEDLVVIYISSHGTSAEADAASATGQTGYIVTHETDVQNLYATAFPMDEMKRVVDDRMRAGRVVTFLDTCYSGDTVRQRGGGKALSLGFSQELVNRIAQGKGRVVITSSRNTEKSWESDRIGNSFFTHYLVEAMRASKGEATVTKLFTYLERNVPEAVKKEKSSSQNPTMSPEGRNIDIVIGTAVE